MTRAEKITTAGGKRPARLVPDWVRHDGLCQARRSMGRIACDCSARCNCAACREDRCVDAIEVLAVAWGRRNPGGLAEAQRRIDVALAAR